MEEIIQPIAKELLMAELTPERRLRMTNKSNNAISRRRPISRTTLGA